MSHTIHNFIVDGDPDGIRYLEELGENESKTLFKEAHEHGKSYFEHNEKHYEIARIGETGKYLVARVQHSSSFF